MELIFGTAVTGTVKDAMAGLLTKVEVTRCAMGKIMLGAGFTYER